MTFQSQLSGSCQNLKMSLFSVFLLSEKLPMSYNTSGQNDKDNLLMSHIDSSTCPLAFIMCCVSPELHVLRHPRNTCAIHVGLTTGLYCRSSKQLASPSISQHIHLWTQQMPRQLKTTFHSFRLCFCRKRKATIYSLPINIALYNL